MHGVFDGVARNENVAIHVGKSDIGNDEAVAILMENEAALDFVAGSGFLLCDLLVRGLGSGGGITLRAAEKEASVGKFLDEAASLQFGEHLEERAAVTFFHMEGAGKILDGDGVISKLKKTKDIVGTQVGGARHGLALSVSEGAAAQF